MLQTLMRISGAILQNTVSLAKDVPARRICPLQDLRAMSAVDPLYRIEMVASVHGRRKLAISASGKIEAGNIDDPASGTVLGTHAVTHITRRPATFLVTNGAPKCRDGPLLRLYATVTVDALWRIEMVADVLQRRELESGLLGGPGLVRNDTD